MFEKEAKKHKEEFIDVYLNVGGGLNSAYMIGMQKEQSYKEGAEFGYNKYDERLIKANEIIKGLMRFCRCVAQHHTEDIRYKEAEQFLRELEE